ncbi:MAG: hypothetical protein KGI89_14960 [Euryarchaeota archaeon]|nr:hypothetical protein [Euryarchaeota archaeon]
MKPPKSPTARRKRHDGSGASYFYFDSANKRIHLHELTPDEIAALLRARSLPPSPPPPPKNRGLKRFSDLPWDPPTNVGVHPISPGTPEWEEMTRKNLEGAEQDRRDFPPDPNEPPPRPPPPPLPPEELRDLWAKALRIHSYTVLPPSFIFPRCGHTAYDGAPCLSPSTKGPYPVRAPSFANPDEERFSLAELFRRSALFLARPIPSYFHTAKFPIPPHEFTSYDASKKAILSVFEGRAQQALTHLSKALRARSSDDPNIVNPGAIVAIYTTRKELTLCILSDIDLQTIDPMTFAATRLLPGPTSIEDIPTFFDTAMSLFMEHFQPANPQLNQFLAGTYDKTRKHRQPGIYTNRQLHRSYGLARDTRTDPRTGLPPNCSTPVLHKDPTEDARFDMGPQSRISPDLTTNPKAALTRCLAQCATTAILSHPTIPLPTLHQAVRSSPYLRDALRLDLLPEHLRPPGG